MRAVAIPMILLMLSASLAGCTSGDPDGDDNSGIDMEILNQMIDDNLQDFINNTTVDVINNNYENHTITNVINQGNTTENLLFTIYGTIRGEENISFGLINDIEMIVRSDTFPEGADLDGMNVCLEIGGAVEGILLARFSDQGMSYSVSPSADIGEGLAEFMTGTCDTLIGLDYEIQWAVNSLTSEGWQHTHDFWEFNGSLGSTSDDVEVFSKSEVNLHQNSGEAILLRHVYATVELQGYCEFDCGSEDVDNYSRTFTIDAPSTGAVFWQTGQSSYWDTRSGALWSCENGIQSSRNFWDGAAMFAPGLECDITLDFEASWQELIGWPYISNPIGSPYDRDGYNWEWSDWTFYIYYSIEAVNVDEINE